MIDSAPIRMQQIEFENQQAAEQSTKFTDLNQAFFQNLLADIAQERMSLPVDPANVSAYGYQAEYLRGQIAVVQHILALAATHTS